MTRQTITSATPPPVTGGAYADNVAEHVRRLWDASALPLTAVGGTANAVTATLAPPLLAGLVDGMKFSLTWAAQNTGGMTLALNGGAAVAVLDALGAALVGGAVRAGERMLIEYAGGAFRLLSGAAGTGGAGPYRVVFTASGTWTVPTGYDDESVVLLEAWGAGGGGNSATTGGGGGGGGYASRLIRYGDLGPSYTVTVPAGGAVGAGGGSTTIGALLTAYGGGGSSSASGGGGGGLLGAGVAGASSSLGGAGGAIGGGTGGADAMNGSPAQTAEGGGGGGGRTMNGGAAYRGGGGGAGNGGIGGISMQGGAGGASGVAGSAPGGGGGRNAAGGRGEARITIFG